MGYAQHRFTGSVDDNLLCAICSGILERAVLTPCGHSFCQRCLQTWLDNPNVHDTCPECRSHVQITDAHPVHAIRNLIQGLEVTCENAARGCTVSVQMDNMTSHLNVCGHTAVECAGCSLTISRQDLAQHHNQCDAIKAIINTDNNRTGSYPDSTNSRPDRSYIGRSLSSEYRSARHYLTEPYISDLTVRVTTLEIQLQKLKTDLDIAQSKNKKLDRELKRARSDLENKRFQLLEQHYSEFDPEYEYGYTPQSIIKLSQLISRYLLDKPLYIDDDIIFRGLKRCYDNYVQPFSYQTTTSQCSSRKNFKDSIQDVHMLLVTANACNWFSQPRRQQICHWLQVVCNT